MKPVQLTPIQAAALGLIQGPIELLPVSSSAHTALAAWAMRIRYEDIDPNFRKSFEVTLHAGTSIAMLILRSHKGLTPQYAILSCLPTAALGLALESRIERYLATPKSTAIGLIAGSLTMLPASGKGGGKDGQQADANKRWFHKEKEEPPKTRRSKLLSKAIRGLSDRPRNRISDEATNTDAVLIGIAQSISLIPGVSRQGVTVAAAAARGFTRKDAEVLSDRAALPVLLAATG